MSALAPAVSSSSEVGVLALFKKARLSGSRAGIALGESDFALASVRRRPDSRPLLEHLSVHELPTGTAQQAVTTAVQQHKLTHVALSAAVGPNDYQLVQVEAPDVLPSELRAAIRWRLRDVIQFNVDEAVVDVFELPESARRNQAKMVFAVAAKAASVQRVSGMLAEARRFDAIDIPELCLRNVSALLPQDSAGVALLVLSANFGQLIVTRQGVLYLTRRIEFARRTPNFHQAAKAPDSIDPSAVALELQRSLDYYESHFDLPPITSLVVAPADERARELASSLNSEINLKVSHLTLDEILELAPGVKAQTTWFGLVAIGAALRQAEA